MIKKKFTKWFSDVAFPMTTFTEGPELVVNNELPQYFFHHFKTTAYSLGQGFPQVAVHDLPEGHLHMFILLGQFWKVLPPVCLSSCETKFTNAVGRVDSSMEKKDYEKEKMPSPEDPAVLLVFLPPRSNHHSLDKTRH